jgi:hypothetical protein
MGFTGNVEGSTICAEKDDDWETLAKMLKLEASDAPSWVQNYEATPKKGKQYSVPNLSVFFITSFTEEANPMIWKVLADMLRTYREDDSKGYKTEWSHSDSQNEFIEKWRKEGLYRFNFGGHGAERTKRIWGLDIHDGWLGLVVDQEHVETNRKAVVDSSEVDPSYRLALVILNACGSASMGWQTHVSKNGGMFIGYKGETDILNYKSQRVVEIFRK